MQAPVLHVAVIGAGEKSAALLRALAGMERVRVAGVAASDPEAPGARLARELGIPVTAEWRALVGRPDLDVVVQPDPDPAVTAEIRRLEPVRAHLLPPGATELVLALVEAGERLIRRLRERDRERDLILDSTHDGVLAVNGEGLVTVCNTAAERLLGVGREKVLGRPAAEVIPGTRLHAVLQSGKPELNQQQDLGSTTIVTNRMPVRDESGRVVGAVAVFRDITEVKALAEEITDLRETKALLEAIIHSTQDAISVVDSRGMGLLVNPAYTRLTGLTPEQVIGKPATVDIDETQESMHLQVLRTRRPVRGVPMKVGPRRRDVIVDVAPILVDGELKGSVGVIHDVSEILRLTEELEQQKKLVRRLQSKYTFEDIVATSPTMQMAVEQARRAAETPATVLLRGESGTGKELFAHAIHNASGRPGEFVRVNCAAIPDQLLESELFGYADGAFTGARRGGRRGLFEEAQGGTIFLDEIGDLSLGLQAKLLRVLQEKEIRRVGETTPIPVNVRIIAATNANLEDKMARGEFREDLYYRLNVIPIFIPPLRHRREDIPTLVERFVERFNREYGRAVTSIDPAVMEPLMRYHWPGNVRELENVISRAMVSVDVRESVLLPRHLPPLDGLSGGRHAPAPAGPGRTATAVLPLADVVAAAEREALRRALEATGGNKTEAARRLGIAPRTLYYKLERHGLLGAR
ncbi:sigma 54-interacting transcriptional regulator [Caldinitratiruptor microaerophilus]|uniref:Sigma L-dependent transcriptional regulator YqiR n=1 Tax=Caldinitratiruptor microaerophilus TaxID=671077 RepID=A0AA35CIU1_9FIRM|nr:sigma 54-interacting transcriptional regulator [Caldinitratiruptor microaerophilus]BDG59927.1 putative sigma L-dependent transcriptional regulator YqiR [Caldinitratiruptor microaerophilus]